MATKKAPSTGLGRYKSLTEIAEILPSIKHNKKLSEASLTKWITLGVRDMSGQLVRLEARRFPGGWKLTEQAVEEFLAKLTKTALDQFDPEDPKHKPNERHLNRAPLMNLEKARRAKAARMRPKGRSPESA